MTNSHVLGIDIIKKDEENIFNYIYNYKSKKEEEHKKEDMNDRRRYVNGKPLLTLIFNLYNHIANNIFKKLYAQSINLCR